MYKFPFMEKFTDDVSDYLAEIERLFTSGSLSPVAFHLCLGKASAYVEAQYGLDYLTLEQAADLISEIESYL